MPSPRGLYSGISLFSLASSVVPRTGTNERVLIPRVAPVATPRRRSSIRRTVNGLDRYRYDLKTHPAIEAGISVPRGREIAEPCVKKKATRRRRSQMHILFIY